jgi:PAS domain S-box-containing protein
MRFSPPPRLARSSTLLVPPTSPQGVVQLGAPAYERMRRLAVRLLRVPVARVVVPPPSSAATSTASPAERLAGAVLRLGEPLVAGDARGGDALLRDAAHAEGWGAVLAVPLTPFAASAPAVLVVADTVPRAWHDDDVAALLDLVALPVGAALALAGAPPWLAALVRREAQLARRKSEERMALIVDSTEDLIVLVSVERGGFRCAAINGACLAVTGLTESRVIGREVREVLAPDVATRVARRLRDAVRGGQPVRHHEEFTLPLGRATLEVTLTPIVDDETETCTHVLGVARDVTARVRAEEALRDAIATAEAACAEAEAASTAKSEFLSRLSHELRTPLNAIIGYVHAMRDDGGGDAAIVPRHRGYLDRIAVGGQHMLALIDDLLDVARIEAGTVAVSVAPVALDDLVRDTAGLFEQECGARSLELRLEVPELLDPLSTDAVRLRQVLVNLLGNACKFTERGGVVVRVMARDGRPTRIEVQDSGVGIARERLTAIFQPFEGRSDAAASGAAPGLGLGLAISRSLCTLLGYTLTVVSEPGRGTTFTVELAGSGAAGDGGA